MPAHPPFPCRLFLFDLDGTLIDSKRDITESVNRALVRMNVPVVPVAKLADFVGNGVQVLIRKALGESLGAEADSALLRNTIQAYLQEYEAHLLDFTTLYGGVSEALQALRWADMAVITNKPERFSRRILDALGVGPLFRIVLGGDSTDLRKPDPAPLLLVMTECGVPPSETVMVGDSLVDMMAGKAAGVYTCGITGGFRPLQELEQSGCDLILQSVGGMIPYFCPVA